MRDGNLLVVAFGAIVTAGVVVAGVATTAGSAFVEVQAMVAVREPQEGFKCFTLFDRLVTLTLPVVAVTADGEQSRRHSLGLEIEIQW
ncbi:hypothetical protein L1887_29973 [Cichorium endivia]|nr:hypothetical protein L1887_29973 [Cichorium endivia]